MTVTETRADSRFQSTGAVQRERIIAADAGRVEVHLYGLSVCVDRARLALTYAGDDLLVALLPGSSMRAGQAVISAGRLSAVLERPWQTVRYDRERRYLSRPMVMPTTLLAAAFARRELREAVLEAAIDGLAGHDFFEHFDATELMTRQAVFSVEPASGRVAGDLLEDAFDGVRFRVPPRQL